MANSPSKKIHASSPSPTEIKNPKHAQSSLPVVLPVMAILLGSVVFGMHMHFVGVSKATMTDHVKSKGDHIPLPADDKYRLRVFPHTEKGISGTDGMRAFNASINLGAMFGCLLTGLVSDMIGRKSTMLLLTPFLIAFTVWIAIGSEPFSLISARFFSGIVVGGMSTIVPTYIGEVCPKHIRGLLSACNQVAKTSSGVLVFALGFLVSTDDGATMDTKPYKHWRNLMWIHLVPAGLILLICWMIPETPRFFANKGKKEEALKSLSRLRGGEPSAEEYDAIVEQCRGANSRSLRIGEEKMTLGQRIKRKFELLRSAKRQLFVGGILMVFVQTTGVSTIGSSQNSILADAKIESVDLMSTMIGLTKIFSTVGCILLVERLGRRSLLLATCAGNVIGSLGLAAGFYYKMTWLTLLAMFLYHIFYSLGIGAVPWVICGEIFPNKVRGLSSSIAVCVFWLTGFGVNYTFDVLTKPEVLGYHGSFFLFACTTVCMMTFTWFFVPETKGKSLEEIEGFFKRNKRTGELHPQVITVIESDPETTDAEMDSENRTLVDSVSTRVS